MIELVITAIIISFTAVIIYKNFKNAKKGKGSCSSCPSSSSCSGCSINKIEIKNNKK